MPTYDRQWIMSDAATPTMRLVTDEPQAAAADAESPADVAGVGDVAEGSEDLGTLRIGFDRRAHRRFDVESLDVSIERWDGRRDGQNVLGRVVDLSAGGIRLRTRQIGVRPDQQIRVRLELPANGGIAPFVDTADGQYRPKREWVGWLAVGRVATLADGSYDIAGRLVDMEEMDRGMLGLYLSTQPLAA